MSSRDEFPRGRLHRKGAERRAKILEWISESARTGSAAPTGREMARRLGISAPAVCLHLRRLISDGRVQILHKGRGGLQFKVPEVGTTERVR